MRAFLTLFTMWGDTRKVALMAMTAGLYTAGSLTTVYLQIIPGVTNVRPAAVIPIVLGSLLGAPACWGAALGNLTQDLLGGQFGPGSAVGFLANFLMAMVAWRVAAATGLPDLLSETTERLSTQDLLLRFMPVAILGSAACATTLGWGLDIMGLAPFVALANIVFLNNAGVSLLLGPPLLALLGRRVYRWELADDTRRPSPNLRGVALMLLTLGALGAYLTLNGLCLGVAPDEGLPGVAPVGAAGLGLILLGLLLL